MAVLHVRDISDALYRRMQKIAKEHGRSLSAEVIALLEQAVRQEDVRRRQAKLLKTIRDERWTPPSGAPEASAALLQARDEREAELMRRAAR
jgi:plasmid stability protein